MSEHTTLSSQTEIKVSRLCLVRAYTKFVATVLAMEVTAGVALLGMLLLFAFPVTRRRFRRFMFRVTTRSMIFCMRVKVKKTGKPPKKPYIMVGNHCGYLDILVLASITGATFVSKKEVRDWPGVGPVSALYNTIYIDREKRADVHRVSSLVEQNIQKGDGIIIFPEGTSTAGQEVLPFHSSLFDFPARANFPVHTFTLRYETRNAKLPASHAVCWWGDIDFMPHMRMMLATKRLYAFVEFHEPTQRAEKRKQLAEASYDEVMKHFEASETYSE